MNDLDQKLRDYYASQELSEDKLQQILSSTKILRPPWWKQPANIIAIAACITLLLATPILLQQTNPSLQKLVSMDVAKNHLKQLAPEVQTASWQQIQAALPRLSFAISPTRPDMLAGLDLVGGRYCTILDELAAQISMIDAKGKPCTLYIAPLTAALEAVRPGVYESNGVTVQIWHDAHRIFALAR